MDLVRLATFRRSQRRGRRLVATGIVAGGLLAFTRAALAADPPPPQDGYEPAIVPAIGGSTDVGFGGGVLGSLTRFAPGASPYLWHLEGAAFVTTGGSNPSSVFPYQQYYVDLTIPHFLDRRLRLFVEPSYNREAYLEYWGLGNASVYAPRWASIDPSTDPKAYAAARRYDTYILLRPGVRTDLRIEVRRPLYVMVGAMFTQNAADVAPHSQIEADRHGASGPVVRDIVSGPDDYGVLLFDSGLVYDSRDDETAPQQGMLHKLSARLSPGGAGELPYRYAGFTGNFRFYEPLIRHRLTLALRLVGDALVGHAPLNELARFDTMAYAIGGVDGVRGVPALRYYGRAKVLGNVELRAPELFAFRVFGERVRYGFAAFFDGGRLWADYQALPALDGTGIGLHYGLGGGPRLQVGRAFVVRFDVAWSPEARPIAAYLKAGHMF
ncbi:MAG TPA: BamA/TamA family outer membrane protein [Minicystis sp.]|nr:BamA/TamA family outer membrane protein [Minicystis sp.]